MINFSLLICNFLQEQTHLTICVGSVGINEAAVNVFIVFHYIDNCHITGVCVSFKSVKFDTSSREDLTLMFEASLAICFSWSWPRCG